MNQTGIFLAPTRKRPQPDWQYVQLVKQRVNGRVKGTRLKVIYGDETEVTALLGQSTAYVERTHLTMRHFNSRLARKTLAYSKVLAMHKAAAAWEDIVYNFVRPLTTLCLDVQTEKGRRKKPQTPAMAASLTDYVWTFNELLTTVHIPLSDF